jgi:hypothetical protein
MTPRIFITLVGAWLLVSGFAWPHSHFEVVNLITVGFFAPIFAWLSTARDWALWHRQPRHNRSQPDHGRVDLRRQPGGDQRGRLPPRA